MEICSIRLPSVLLEAGRPTVIPFSSASVSFRFHCWWQARSGSSDHHLSGWQPSRAFRIGQLKSETCKETPLTYSISFQGWMNNWVGFFSWLNSYNSPSFAFGMAANFDAKLELVLGVWLIPLSVVLLVFSPKHVVDLPKMNSDTH